MDVGDVDLLAKLLLGIARHEQHRQRRHQLADFAGHRRAVHVGHDDVADDEVVLAAELDEVEALLTVARGVDLVAGARERAFGDHADGVLVLYQQHPSAAGPLHRRSRGRLGRRAVFTGSRLMDREVNGEARPPPGLALGKDEAARLFDDAIDGRETEARALPLLLGGEERLEDLGEVLGRDAAARVLDHQAGIFAHRQHVAALGAHVGGGDALGGERQPAAAVDRFRLHRVARVDHQVDDHLLELRRVRAHRAEVAVVPDDELDLLADQPLEHLRDVGDDVGQLEHLGPQRLLAREGEELTGQRRGARRVRADLLDVVVIGIARRVAQQHQIAGAEDRGQHVVEIVRDAAGELPHRLHLRGLRDLPLEPRLLRRIGQAQQHRRVA